MVTGVREHDGRRVAGQPAGAGGRGRRPSELRLRRGHLRRTRWHASHGTAGARHRASGPRATSPTTQLDELAAEIRDELVRTVRAARGGHLGPNLGVVELTLAIHRVFDSPRDRVVFDTGHQAYVHKMLTGRAAAFDTLRTEGGLSRLPEPGRVRRTTSSRTPTPPPRCPTPTGWPRPTRIRGEDRHVVAVIGDGALTGGMAWEALNNIAIGKRPQAGHRRQRQRPLLHADRRRPRRPPRHAAHQPALRAGARPGQDAGSTRCRGVGPAVYDALHAMKKGMKDALAPQGMFEDLGLKYVGPIDGHDRAARGAGARPGQALRRPGDRARASPARASATTRPSATRPTSSTRSAPFDVRDRRGAARRAGSGPTSSPRRWSRSARERQDVVAITAAMLTRSGSTRSPRRSPSAPSTSASPSSTPSPRAAGLAMGGLHPVVAVYATFLNRAFDQVLMDVALHKCGVTFVLDRAGCHRRRRRQPQRHVGHVDPPGRARPAARRAARRRPAARAAPRGRRRSTTPRPSCGCPKGAAARRTSRRSTRPAAATCWSARAPRTSSSSRVGSMADRRRRGRRAARRPGHRRHRRRPALGQAGRPRARRARPRAPARGQRRGQRPRRRLRRGAAADRSTTPACTRRSACTASRRSSSTTPSATRSSSGSASTPQTIARGIVEDVTALGRGDAPRRRGVTR